MTNLTTMAKAITAAVLEQQAQRGAVPMLAGVASVLVLFALTAWLAKGNRK
jgi:type IV secretory pathway TrbD component